MRFLQKGESADPPDDPPFGILRANLEKFLLTNCDGAVSNDAQLIWYASYGSNLDRDRLCCYLEGGTAVAARKANAGARDPTPPRDDAALVMPFELFFADVSHVWTGGVAFVDHRPDPRAATYARAFLITVEQLADVVAQESARPVGSIELGDAVAEVEHRSRVSVGPGRYDTILRVGEIGGIACLTFTGRTPREATPLTRPASDYLSMMAGGLRTAHQLDDEQIVGYLRERPGLAGTWTDAALHEAIAIR